MIGGSDIVWVGEQRGCIGSEKWGREEEKKRFFGCGWVWERWNDGFSIGIVFDLGKRKERKRIN